MSVHVTVKLFAILRDKAGVAETTLTLPDGTDVAAAARLLGERFPTMASFLPRIAFAVNRSYVPAGTVLQERDELALIPPVSGG